MAGLMLAGGLLPAETLLPAGTLAPAGTPILAGSLLLRRAEPRACPPGSGSRLVNRRSLRVRRLGRWGERAPALLVGGLLTAALWIAPEAPQDQAAICQRHNGVAACRVW
jgi:hypothetical protein